MLMRTSAALLWFVLTAASVQAFPQKKSGEARQLDSQKDSQEGSGSKKEDVVRISVTLVQVDAVVTDKKGNRVTDLQKDDFEIFEDGKRQLITNFSFVSTPTPPSKTPQPTLAPQINKTAPVPSPAVRLKPEQVRRTIAIVVDDLSLTISAAEAVRYHLRRFVDQQMAPGDLVAIIRASGGMGALQQFTADKRQLYPAIERVRWNPRAGQTGAFAPISDETLQSKVKGTISDASDKGKQKLRDDLENFRDQLFAVGVLGALNYVVRGLRELPGRKSVMFISSGFNLPNQGSVRSGMVQQPADRVSASLRRLIELANRSAVVIYAIDPRGIVVPMLDGSDDVRGFGWQQRSELLRQRAIQLSDSNNGLNYLAQETGGFLATGSNDLSRGIRRVIDDQSSYFLLGYVPAESTFKRTAGQLAFHKISIKVKRPGFTVRTRGGFLGVTDDEARPAHLTPAEQLTAAVTSPFTSGDVHLRLTSLFGNDAKTGYFVRSLLHIDARDLTFGEEIDGWRDAGIDVTAIAFGDNGTVVEQNTQSYSLKVRAHGMDRTLRSGLVYGINLPLKKPGAYQLRTAVRDAKSQKIGSANQYIEVPDINKGRPVISTVALGGNNLLIDLTRPGYSGEPTEEEEVRIEAGPAVRRLRSANDLNYAFVLYNARVDKGTNAPRLLMQTRLFRGGKLVYEGEAATLRLSPQPDWKRISVAGSMKLAKSAQPGDYILQIVITDPLAKEKYRTITEWTDFEIVR
jgi:VWFA-related protein